jgi:peptide deformylase
MTIKSIIKMGHPALKRVADLITQEEFNSDELKDLIADLYETMKIEKGIGIAAPQIAISKQVALIELPEDSERYGILENTPLLTIINPIITILDSTLQGYWEGCLSVPGLKGHVERPRKIRVDYFDETGRYQTITSEGFLATVFQHELDHLFGYLYVERMSNLAKLAYLDEFKQFHEIK